MFMYGGMSGVGRLSLSSSAGCRQDQGSLEINEIDCLLCMWVGLGAAVLRNTNPSFFAQYAVSVLLPLEGKLVTAKIQKEIRR